MALTDAQKKIVRNTIHQAYSDEEIIIPWIKPNMDAAIDALDNWLDANAAAVNTTLPQPYRDAASTSDKAVLLATLTVARYLVDNPSLAAVLSRVASQAQRVTE